jgi:CRISP-associated protein Cas1
MDAEASMLLGRLGIDDSRIPHSDRHGLIFLSRGHLRSRSGTLVFGQDPDGAYPEGEYDLPIQTISMILLGPGSTVSHDALRLLSVYGAALAAVGDDGVRLYTAPAIGLPVSALARKHALLWADPEKRLHAARRMYAWRFGELLPHRDLNVLRGIEGGRVKQMYKTVANREGITWRGRHYDRGNPEASDLANQAINHASSAVEAAASIAVTATGAIPSLGFIHEDPGQSFILDIADLFRSDIIVPCAFKAVKIEMQRGTGIERLTRKETGRALREKKVISEMISIIKALVTSSPG